MSVVQVNNADTEYTFQSEVLTEDVVPLIAALSAQDTDDTRQAIKYLRKAGELADKSQGEQVTVDHAREAQALVEREAVVEAMREMTTQADLGPGCSPLYRKRVYLQIGCTDAGRTTEYRAFQ